MAESMITKSVLTITKVLQHGLQPVFGLTPFSFINLMISSIEAFEPFIFQFPPTKNFRPDIFVSLIQYNKQNCKCEMLLGVFMINKYVIHRAIMSSRKLVPS